MDMDQMNTHPCKNCLVFGMCQSRLQESIKDITLDYSYEVNNEATRRAILLSAFSNSITHCSIIHNYIDGLINDKMGLHFINRNTIRINALYEVFNINSLMDFNRS